jgi:hypothetical protein
MRLVPRFSFSPRLRIVVRGARSTSTEIGEQREGSARISQQSLSLVRWLPSPGEEATHAIWSTCICESRFTGVCRRCRRAGVTRAGRPCCGFAFSAAALDERSISDFSAIAQPSVAGAWFVAGRDGGDRRGHRRRCEIEDDYGEDLDRIGDEVQVRRRHESERLVEERRWPVECDRFAGDDQLQEGRPEQHGHEHRRQCEVVAIAVELTAFAEPGSADIAGIARSDVAARSDRTARAWCAGWTRVARFAPSLRRLRRDFITLSKISPGFISLWDLARSALSF